MARQPRQPAALFGSSSSTVRRARYARARSGAQRAETAAGRVTTPAEDAPLASPPPPPGAAAPATCSPKAPLF